MNELENDYARFWKEQGILFSSLKKPMEFGVEEVSEIIKLRHRISNKEHQYWCMDNRNLKSASREANDYIGKYGQDLIHACAIISDSFLTKFMVELFIRVQKPKVPLKVFSSEGSAVDWLREMQNKQNNIAVNVKA